MAARMESRGGAEERERVRARRGEDGRGADGADGSVRMEEVVNPSTQPWIISRDVNRSDQCRTWLLDVEACGKRSEVEVEVEVREAMACGGGR